MKLLLYCTKAKPILYKPFELDCFPNDEASRFYLGDDRTIEIDEELNGKIVAECDYEVEKIIYRETTKNNYSFGTETLTPDELLDKSCLTILELCKYIGSNKKWIKGDYGYAIHIKNLNIFNEPKKLTDCYRIIPPDEIGCRYKSIRKAHQNMMYAYDYFGDDDKKVLISIRPEWLCKILNGEKTVEVRKVILKEMLNGK